MLYPHLVAEFYSRAWAVRKETLIAMRQLVDLRAAGETLSEAQIKERISSASYAGPRQRVNAPGNVALIPIVGVISHRMNMMSNVSGGTSIEKLTAQFRQALNDPNTKAIVFDVDSPGGSVDGVQELAEEIYQGRKKKPSVAIARTQAASAAYWLAASAGELVITPSGSVGSIGVYAAHQDISKALEQEGVNVTLISAGKYKTEGNPFGPLEEEARAAMQSKVDDYYAAFVKDVATGRKASQASVREGYGQGRMLLAADAVKENLADRVATIDDVLASFGASSSSSSAAAKTSGSARADDDQAAKCQCACNACKSCEFKNAEASADDDQALKCACACDACKACENKAANARDIVLRRRRLALASF